MSYLDSYVAVSAGVNTSVTIPMAGIKGVIIRNESPLDIRIQADGVGGTPSIAADWADYIPIPSRGFNGNLHFFPSSQLTIQNAPSSQLAVVPVGIHESTPQGYPMRLGRLSNQGNLVGTQALNQMFPFTNCGGSSVAYAAGTGKTPFLTGFDLTSSTIAGNVSRVLTVTGLRDGSLSYQLVATTSGLIFEKTFASPQPGVLSGTIGFTVPNFGTTVDMNIYGYIQ